MRFFDEVQAASPPRRLKLNGAISLVCSSRDMLTDGCLCGQEYSVVIPGWDSRALCALHKAPESASLKPLYHWFASMQFKLSLN
jgi:hypothetical protein